MDRISGRSLAARLFGASPARTLLLLQAAWPLAVGPELARRTEVIGIEGGTLRVRVPDASWRKVLHRIQPRILGRLRDIAGDLAPRRMGFLEGGLSKGSESGVERREAAVDGGGVQGGPQPTSQLVAAVRTPNSQGVSAPPEINDIESQAATIADAEIRSRFVQSAARYLARAKDAKGRSPQRSVSSAPKPGFTPGEATQGRLTRSEDAKDAKGKTDA